MNKFINLELEVESLCIFDWYFFYGFLNVYWLIEELISLEDYFICVNFGSKCIEIFMDIIK